MNASPSNARGRPSSEALIQQRIARTIRMLSLLKAGPIYNTQRLADEFSVSRRTVYRDLRALRNAGVPILIDKWSDAYYVRAQREPGQIPLDYDQVVLLALAAHLSPLNCSRQHASRIRSAITALMGRLPHSTQLELGHLLSSAQAEAYPLPSEMLDTILLSLRCKQPIKALMKTDQGVYVDLDISPCQLVASVDGWQLVGRLANRRDPRTFNVSSFLSVERIEPEPKLTANRSRQQFESTAKAGIRSRLDSPHR